MFRVGRSHSSPNRTITNGSILNGNMNRLYHQVCETSRLVDIGRYTYITVLIKKNKFSEEGHTQKYILFSERESISCFVIRSSQSPFFWRLQMEYNGVIITYYWNYAFTSYSVNYPKKTGNRSRHCAYINICNIQCGNLI